MMQTETVAIADLRPPKRNVRVHPEKQIVELARAVEKFGQTRPVVVDETGMVLAGNGLVEAFKRLGRAEISAYRMVGLSAADKTKIMLSDNKIFALGLDDHGAILDEIRGLDLDFDIPGFDDDVLKNLMMETATVSDTALDNFGVLPASAVAAARARQIPKGSTQAPQPAAASDDEDAVRCPQCGHTFFLDE